METGERLLRRLIDLFEKGLNFSGTVVVDTTQLEAKVQETNNILNDQTVQLQQTMNATVDLDANFGTKADTSAPNDTGTFSFMSLFKRNLQASSYGNAAQDLMSAKLPASLGSKLSADSLSITAASDQPLPVSVTSQPDGTQIGNITSSGQSVTLVVPAGGSSLSVQLTGTFVGVVTFESSIDGGITYNARVLRFTGILNNLQTSTSIFPSEWRGNVGGMSHARVRCTAFTSGTLGVFIRAAQGQAAIFLNAPVPIGGISVGNNVPAQSVAAGDSWVGAWEDMENVDSISIAYKATQMTIIRLQRSLDSTTVFDEDTFTITANTTFRIEIGGGPQYFRIKADNISAFTASVTAEAVYRTAPVSLVKMALAFGPNRTTLGGVVATVPYSNQRRTYSATATFAVGTLATDLFTITGALNKTAYINRIQITGSATAATTVDFIVLKRSGANVGGTSITLTAVPHDSADGAATSTVQAYTANPLVLGAAIGDLRRSKASLPSLTSTAFQSSPIQFSFGGDGKQITINSADEVLSLNLNGVTVAGLSLSVWVEWVEQG